MTELDDSVVEEWEFEIDEATCKKAVLIMDYLIEEKFRLMPPEFTMQSVAALVNNDPKEQFVIDEGTKIKKTLEYEGTKKSVPGKITPSEAVQGRLFTPPKIRRMVNQRTRPLEHYVIVVLVLWKRRRKDAGRPKNFMTGTCQEYSFSFLPVATR